MLPLLSSPSFNTNNLTTIFNDDENPSLITDIGIGIPGTSSSKNNKRKHQRDRDYNSSFITRKKIKIFGDTLTEDDLKLPQNPEPNNDSELSRITSKDSQFPIERLKGSQFPVKPLKDSQFPIIPSQFPVKPSNDSQFPVKPSTGSQFLVKPSNDSQFPIIPSKGSQFPVKPSKDSQFPVKPSKDFVGVLRKIDKSVFSQEVFDQVLARVRRVFPLVSTEILKKELLDYLKKNDGFSADIVFDKFCEVLEQIVKGKLEGIKTRIWDLFPWVTTSDLERELAYYSNNGTAVPTDYAFSLMVEKFSEKFSDDEDAVLQVIKKERFKRICIEPWSQRLVASDRKHFSHAVSCSTGIASIGLKVYKVEYICNAELEERYSKAKAEYEEQGWKVSECNVFHGTDDNAMEKIIVEGFKIGGKDVHMKHGDSLGYGVYAAKNASFSLRYREQPYKLLLCAALFAHIKKGRNSKEVDELNYKERGGVFAFAKISDLVPRYIIHSN